ncbi:efflux RND transporter periplasmic adaptor subunit [Alteromonas pelagimontana]|uniref:Efflux RND transporter periplasmic adaptor subunit n=1 Tax=Alteromonas pelagimontana TaxID=1858656 RepID=A0A6M4MBL8_9ALTE|nr:efflux RND transporter periplasmic adaptor subunit [Alteromonas pelagimontana]
MTFVYKISIIIWVTMLLIACSDVQSSPENQANATPAIPVDVAPVVSHNVAEWDNFTGRLEAPQTVALRPRVSGYIDFVAFEEGEWVEQGATLFLIDNRAFKAEVNRLSAQIQEAKSRLKLAQQDFSRAITLKKTDSVSKELVDNRESAVDQAHANVAEIQAALDTARLNRGFARVEAPIAGRVSRANITAGNYVTAGQTVLTSIVSTEKLYAYFDIDEQTYLNYISEAKGKVAHMSQLPVAMRLVNEQDYTHWGQLDFVDNQINGSTGTMRVRAVFPNKSGALVPGLFAHLKLAGGDTRERILIDEKAIGTDLNNKFVLIVNQDNSVAYRAVELGDKAGSMRFIKSGLEPGETIVVNGLQRVRPGAVVAPNAIEMADEQSLAELQAWQRHLDDIAELTASTIVPSTGSK